MIFKKSETCFMLIFRKQNFKSEDSIYSDNIACLGMILATVLSCWVRE